MRSEKTDTGLPAPVGQIATQRPQPIHAITPYFSFIWLNLCMNLRCNLSPRVRWKLCPPAAKAQFVSVHESKLRIRLYIFCFPLPSAMSSVTKQKHVGQLIVQPPHPKHLAPSSVQNSVPYVSVTNFCRSASGICNF